MHKHFGYFHAFLICYVNVLYMCICTNIYHSMFFCSAYYDTIMYIKDKLRKNCGMINAVYPVRITKITSEEYNECK